MATKRSRKENECHELASFMKAKNSGQLVHRMTMEDFKRFNSALHEAKDFARWLARDMGKEGDTESEKVFRDILELLYECAYRINKRHYHIESTLTHFPIIIHG